MATIIVPADVVFQGTISPMGLNAPSGCITPTAVATPGAGQPGIPSSKVNHRQHARYAQPNAAAFTVTIPIWVTYGTSGTLVAFKAGSIGVCTGAATVVCDLQKSGVSVLTSPITLNNASGSRVEQSGTIPSPATVAGDWFDAVVTATAGGGTLATGLFLELIVDETPAKKARAGPAIAHRDKTTAEIASLLKVDVATVLRYCGGGLPHDKPRNLKSGNRYNPDEVRAWMAANKRTGAVGRPAELGTDEFATWHTRKEKALALKRERENDVESGKLIDAAAEQQRDLRKITVVRNGLAAWGQRFRLSSREWMARRQALIDKAIEDILLEFSKS